MQSIRQSELFASKDWLVLYQAFNTINFNASDPTSINQAMRDYIAANYPEDFNDWIESSEFIAIIDLLAWCAGVLAFKTDINARENFLETAEARESILRLARFLSYNPRRNRPATGLLKLVEVSSDDDITDSTGASLSGVKVQWNNADDPDWFERFTSILTAAFVSNNPFGTPLKAGTVSNITTQLYRVNNTMSQTNWGFSSSVGGDSMAFELCNADFTDGGLISEQSPDPLSAFNILYQNDGAGNNSPSTGFFLLFKQGSSISQTYNIGSPTENLLLDVDYSGINETDVWVQSVDDSGDVVSNWNKVPAIFSENITYTSIDADSRDIYSVITRDNDNISIRFSDGVFGTAPTGLIKVTARSSNGQQYQIRPADLTRVTKQVSYVSRTGVKRTLNLVFSLVSTVSNSTPRETDAQVQQRAPSTYAAQNRMVSGEDYNTFPLSSNLATKIKAVNRIYSGHSRFVDLNDPTNTYTDVVVTADDGMLYSEQANIYQEIPVSLNRTAGEMVTIELAPFLRNLNVKTYVANEILTRVEEGAAIPEITILANTLWNQATTAKYSSSGSFTHTSTYFRVGTSIKFLLPNGTYKWVTITQRTTTSVLAAPDPGIRGPVTLSEDIPTGSKVIIILPGFDAELDTATVAALTDRFGNAASQRGFSLWYDPEQSLWVIRDTLDSLTTASNTSDIIHVVTVQYYAGSLWKFAARGAKYVFESARKVKWYFGGERVVDSETGVKRLDSLTLLRSNSDLTQSDGRGIIEDRVFDVSKLYYYGDGTQEPRRIQIDYADADDDGQPDDPEAFSSFTDLGVPQSTLFWQVGTNFGQTSYIPIYNVIAYEGAATTIADVPNQIRFHTAANNIAFVSGDIIYMTAMDAFFVRGATGWTATNRRDYRTARGRGGNTAARWCQMDTNQQPDGNGDGIPDDGLGRFVIMYSNNATEVSMQGLPTFPYLIRDGSITFKWKHYSPADHRIDPSITNIVDVFMLTTEYDYLTRIWIANGSDITDMPAVPTELDLRLQMQDYEQYKMFSDQIVWRPAGYKFLFGPGSEADNLRATFKVVKLPNTTYSDGEVQSRVITAINTYFSSEYWDFGETFYFTPLAAYVHAQLAGVIASFVVVPMDEEASFGDGFEINSRSDEIFISTASVNDVTIISSNTAANLRIR